MSEATARNATRNQITIDYLQKRLSLTRRDTIRRDYANISGAIETVEFGTLMGIVAATGKYVPTVSTATDGSQVPVAIMFEELTEIAIAGTVDDVLLLNSGDVNQNLIVFANGTDTLTTMVESAGGDTKSMQDWLIQNGKELKLVDVQDSSEYDN